MSDCPPRSTPAPRGVSILELASIASARCNEWRAAMDDRADFRTTMAAAGAMARATTALTTAIADAVAEGNSQLTERD